MKSSVRAGGERPQHNETFSAKPAGSLAATLLSCPEAFLVKTCVRAGDGPHNHNETVAP